jgi:hypothetical protein
MWTTLALAKKPPKPAPAPPPPPAPFAAAVARWADGEVQVQLLAGAASCDPAPDDDRGTMILRSEDGSAWNVAQIELHPPDADPAGWYPEGAWPVKGLETTATGEVTLAFAAVSLDKSDGSKMAFPTSVRAKWCGQSLSDALATLQDDGSVVVNKFAPGSLHACAEGGIGAVQIVLQRFVGDAGTGWGLLSVSDLESGASSDFFTEGAEKHPVKGVGAGPAWDLAFDPVVPNEEFGQAFAFSGPVHAVWCGEALPTIGADAAGATGAWMSVNGRWFEVKGARLSKEHGLELSTLELTCDRGFNYMDEAVFMSLTAKGKDTTFWSVGGKLVAPPRSWNPVSEKRKAWTVAGDVVDFTALEPVTLGGLTWAVQGKPTVVRCD